MPRALEWRWMKNSKHVSNVTSSCFYEIRQLKHIRCYLDFQSAAAVVHSFVTSCLDYCNGLLAAAPAKQTDELQRVLNTSARVLLRLLRYDFNLHVKVRDQLHWLRIPEWVTYKLCTMVYKCLHGMAPSYLKEMCIPVCSDAHRGHLCSSDKKELKVPRHKLSTYGPRSFGIAGPSKWNALHCHLWDENLSLDQFTSGLKTYLFRQSVALKRWPSSMSGSSLNVNVTLLT